MDFESCLQEKKSAEAMMQRLNEDIVIVKKMNVERQGKNTDEKMLRMLENKLGYFSAKYQKYDRLCQDIMEKKKTEEMMQVKKPIIEKERVDFAKDTQKEEKVEEEIVHMRDEKSEVMENVYEETIEEDPEHSFGGLKGFLLGKKDKKQKKAKKRKKDKREMIEPLESQDSFNSMDADEVEINRDESIEAYEETVEESPKKERKGLFGFLKKNKGDDEEEEVTYILNNDHIHIEEDKEEINKLTIDDFMNKGYDEEQLEIIRECLDINMDVTKIADGKHHAVQMRKILTCMKKGMDVDFLLNPRLNLMQMDVKIICYNNGFDMDLIGDATMSAEEMAYRYAESHIQYEFDSERFTYEDFDKDQRKEILKGVLNEHDITPYFSPKFNHEQMAIIDKGIGQGLDVSRYAYPENPVEVMTESYYKLLKEKY